MKIHIFESEWWEKQPFENLQRGHDVIFTFEALSIENASRFEDAEIISTFIYSDLGANVLRQLPRLKLVATRSTGVDHIDLDYCRENGITVSNVPTYGSHTVAEHTFGLLLTISHKLHLAVDRTRRGDFSPLGLQGFDLRGKTIGVIGTGDIGKHVIRIAKGFEMEVLACDVKPDEEFAREMGFTYTSLQELLGKSDVVTLHVPGNERTRHLISTEQFEAAKAGMILINTARGSLVDNRALMHALADGKVAAAGLDVLPEEPVIREEAELLRSFHRHREHLESILADHILLHLRNVVITPHSAFNTREAVGRILEVTVENIESYIEGKPINVVIPAATNSPRSPDEYTRTL